MEVNNIPSKYWHALIVAISMIIIAGLSSTNSLQRLEWISQDFKTQLFRAHKKANDKIAIVLIDEASLQAMNPIVGRYPWPRSVYADVIDFIGAGEPKAILFDILFTENEKKINNQYSESDLQLAQTSASYPYIYHAALLSQEATDEVSSQLLNKAIPQTFLNNFGISSEKINNKKSINNNYYLPFSELSKLTTGIGIVGINADSDGIYRRANLFQQYQNHYFPALSITPLISNSLKKSVSSSLSELTFNQYNAPLDHQGNYLVNYYGKINKYSISGLLASHQMLLQGETEGLIVSPDEFKDKYVFIGASAIGLEDIKTTPLSNLTPGVEIHASILSSFLNNDHLTKVSKTLIYLISILLSIVSVYSYSKIKRISFKTMVQIVLIAGYIFINIVLFRNNLVLNLSLPVLAILLSWFGSLIYFSFTEGKDKRKVRKMLSQYVSPDILAVVENNYSDHISAEIGTTENVSILFSDIRSFTSISEKLPATNVVELLNIYFSAMNDIIFQYKGTLDKFIGDAIMAFWGAPVKNNEHVLDSVCAGLKMTRELESVNQKLISKNYPPISIGVGINTADVILGNIGSEKKLDYTVIGDGVNLASRLEGLTKKYHVPLIISEFSYEIIANQVPCAKLDLVRVKGKNIPISIYAPMSIPSDPIELQENAQIEAEKINKAFDLYSKKQWQSAINSYQLISNHELAEIFILRCENYSQNPPDKEWDCAYNLDSK